VDGALTSRGCKYLKEFPGVNHHSHVLIYAVLILAPLGFWMLGFLFHNPVCLAALLVLALTLYVWGRR